MADTMEGRIRSELSALERANDAIILLAVESGSRAWGFPSADSDYDALCAHKHGQQTGRGAQSDAGLSQFRRNFPDACSEVAYYHRESIILPTT